MKTFDSLYYISHIENLDSILDSGIFSRAKMSDKKHADIHDGEVLRRRLGKQTPAGKTLNEYVNLYFQPRNAMLYRLTCNDPREDFVVLQISPSVMDIGGTYMSDKNASVHDAKFYSATKANLQHIDENTFKKDYWTDSDDSKKKMMAEMLVPGEIPTDKIIGMYVANKAAQNKVQELAAKRKLPLSVESKMFFLPQYSQFLTDRLSLIKGDMFFSTMQTFTISVNLRGVMGKGLASRTKYQFPDAYVHYQDDCKNKKLQIGKPTLYKRGTRIEEELADESSELKKINGSKWFLFLATKKHWRDNSQLDEIEQSMKWLVANYQKVGILSIALPALGCGLGNLQWKDVGPMMCHYLNKMQIQSCIYLPMEQQINERFTSQKYLLGEE